MFEALIRTRKILSPGKGNLSDFKDGTKVFFHFKTVALYGEDSPLGSMLIDDSKKQSKPMELLIGKKFKFELWEEWLKEMRLGELSQLELDWALCLVYPMLSKSYRNFSKIKSDSDLGGHHHDEEDEETKFKRSNHCCGLQAKTGYGYKDLDKLSEKPPPKLQFTLELLQIIEPEMVEKEIWHMNADEMNENIPELRAEGNDHYRRGNYEKASYCYRKALTILEQLAVREKPGDEDWLRLDQMKIPLLSNLSQCELLLNDYYGTIEHCSDVLLKDPGNLKALYRRAKANAAVWKVSEARKDWAQVTELDPTMSSVVRSDLARLEQEVRLKDEKDQILLKGKLFS